MTFLKILFLFNLKLIVPYILSFSIGACNPLFNVFENIFFSSFVIEEKSTSVFKPEVKLPKDNNLFVWYYEVKFFEFLFFTNAALISVARFSSIL